MRLLLDTHALLWWLSDDVRLGTAARDLIADPENEVLVSVASLWEIVLKVRIGKLQAQISAVVEAVETGGLIRLDIKPEHLARLVALPLHPDHRDPFDHLLVAQALAEDATFVSEDRRVALYRVPQVTCSGTTTATR